MRALFLTTCFLLFSVTGALGRQTTTVILVRHAETAAVTGEGRDPELAAAGSERAAELIHVLGEVDISAVYSTPFKRTRNTAQPIADHLGVEVQVIEPTATFVADMAKILRTDHEGEVVLVVSHSNTVPAIIDALGGGPYEQLGHDEYDDLFVVTISDGRTTVLRLRYGGETP